MGNLKVRTAFYLCKKLLDKTAFLSAIEKHFSSHWYLEIA